MATLKIRYLSVGDWVLMNGEPAKALRLTMTGRTIFKGLSGQIYGSVGGDIFPLPIVPEILEKNGLVRHERDADNPKSIVLSNHFIMARTYADVDWWRVLIYDEEFPSKELFNGIIYSVHQLQHALRLAGVDKEINL